MATLWGKTIERFLRPDLADLVNRESFFHDQEMESAVIEEETLVARTSLGELELRQPRLNLSVPTRRLLACINVPCAARSLVGLVRLIELPQRLRELVRLGLLRITDSSYSVEYEEVTYDLPNEAVEIELFPVLESEVADKIRSYAQTYFRRVMGARTLDAELRIYDAHTYESLLIALGAAQRELFDQCGEDVSREFAQCVLNPFLAS
jgi:hypothetical protein